MSDAISAASLLMAVVAILYGAWYQEIMQAVKITVPRHDKQINFILVNNVLVSRCLPLTVMAVMVFFVFLPDMIEIVQHSLSVLGEMGVKSYSKYDSVRTAFCLVVFVGFTIAVHLCRLTITLMEVRRKLK
jgi:hypothetical protein